jgi:uncharacterized membrane protein
MSTTPDKLVERYLKHLEIELDDLPRDRRREIVDEIGGHITQARADLEQETEADVRNILEGLGDPAEIAADARERFEVPEPAAALSFKPGAVEIGALIMLLIGGLVLPLLGWVIGVILLWVSNAWNVRDKIIGTIFIPGGLGVPVALALLATGTGGSVSCSPVANVRTGAIAPTAGCPDGGASTHYLAIIAVTVLLLAPILTTAYLAYRMRRHPAAIA